MADHPLTGSGRTISLLLTPDWIAQNADSSQFAHFHWTKAEADSANRHTRRSGTGALRGSVCGCLAWNSAGSNPELRQSNGTDALGNGRLPIVADSLVPDWISFILIHRDERASIDGTDRSRRLCRRLSGDSNQQYRPPVSDRSGDCLEPARAGRTPSRPGGDVLGMDIRRLAAWHRAAVKAWFTTSEQMRCKFRWSSAMNSTGEAMKGKTIDDRPRHPVLEGSYTARGHE